MTNDEINEMYLRHEMNFSDALAAARKQAFEEAIQVVRNQKVALLGVNDYSGEAANQALQNAEFYLIRLRDNP